MKISHYEDVICQEEIIDEIICHCCGKSIKPKPIGKVMCNKIDTNELHNIKKYFDYSSIYDGQILDFDICIECLLNWTKTFKIKIEPKRLF